VEWQVSTEGAGDGAAWAADDRAIYYVDPSGRLMVADVTRGEQVQFSKPRPVAGAPNNVMRVQATSDGRLVLQVASGNDAAPLTLVTGWQGVKGKEP
jgi:hypothetical protein